MDKEQGAANALKIKHKESSIKQLDMVLNTFKDSKYYLTYYKLCEAHPKFKNRITDIIIKLTKDGYIAPRIGNISNMDMMQHYGLTIDGQLFIKKYGYRFQRFSYIAKSFMNFGIGFITTIASVVAIWVGINEYIGDKELKSAVKSQQLKLLKQQSQIQRLSQTLQQMQLVDSQRTVPNQNSNH